MTEEPKPPEARPSAPAEDEYALLRVLVEGTAPAPGPEFFPWLVRHLAQAAGTSHAFAAELVGAGTRVRTLARWAWDRVGANIEFDLAGTPGEGVLHGAVCHHSEGVSRKFPGDPALGERGTESYLGVPLPAVDGRVIGVLAVFDERPLPAGPRQLLVCRAFATRAAAELQRLRLECQCARLEQDNDWLREEIKSEHNFDEIIGQSLVLRAVLDKVRLVAGTDTVVLILGETGTGKELIARALHALSKRRDRPLIKVNCAARAPDQLEDELFGQEEEGVVRRVGRYELAHGGTLFLDEISGLPLEVQTRLLRALQERHFERTGGSVPVRVNVRVLAATNRDLRRAVRAKTFRKDLYHRLNVFPIQLPPLRDRREDIPLLAHFLAGKFAARIGKHIESASPATLERLQGYPWPGNVGELRNVIERAVILSPGSTLEVGPEILAVSGPLPAVGPAAEALDLATLERNHIRTVLERTRWVIDGPHGAARLLGLHPNTLRSRLKRLGLQRPGLDAS